MKISQQQLVDLIKEEFAASELNEFGRWRGAIERLLDRDPKTGKRVYAGGTEELKEQRPLAVAPVHRAQQQRDDIAARSGKHAVDVALGNVPADPDPAPGSAPPEGSWPAGQAPVPPDFEGEHMIGPAGGYTEYEAGKAPQSERDRLRSRADAATSVALMGTRPGETAPPPDEDELEELQETLTRWQKIIKS